nr:MAG TPA: hypothetical protein [Caudoviricetes sp.]
MTCQTTCQKPLIFPRIPRHRCIQKCTILALFVSESLKNQALSDNPNYFCP